MSFKKAKSSFKDFLHEQIEFVEIQADQLSTLRQEVDKNSVTQQVIKQYIEKQKLPTKIVDNDFYVETMGIDVNDNVIVKYSFVAEVTEDDGLVYFKQVKFEYNIEKDTMSDIEENDRMRSDDWKVIQSEILKTSKKI